MTPTAGRAHCAVSTQRATNKPGRLPSPHGEQIVRGTKRVPIPPALAFRTADELGGPKVCPQYAYIADTHGEQRPCEGASAKNFRIP